MKITENHNFSPAINCSALFRYVLLGIFSRFFLNFLDLTKPNLNLIKSHFHSSSVTRSQSRLLIDNGIDEAWYSRSINVFVRLSMCVEAERLALQETTRRILSRRASVNINRPSKPQPQRRLSLQYRNPGLVGHSSQHIPVQIAQTQGSYLETGRTD